MGRSSSFMGSVFDGLPKSPVSPVFFWGGGAGASHKPVQRVLMNEMG